MSDSFVEQSKDQQHVLERLVKGLPGIRGYTDKETRRNADFRVRQLIADELKRTRDGLLDVQRQLLKQPGGLTLLADLDTAVIKVQNLTDRVRTASYGYAGLFDAVTVGKEQLDALYSFDVAMLKDVARMESLVAALRASLGDPSKVSEQISQTTAAVTDLAQLFDRRSRAIESPALLAESGYAPEVDAAEVDASQPPAQEKSPAPTDYQAAAPPDESPAAGDQYRLIEPDK